MSTSILRGNRDFTCYTFDTTGREVSGCLLFLFVDVAFHPPAARVLLTPADVGFKCQGEEADWSCWVSTPLGPSLFLNDRGLTWFRWCLVATDKRKESFPINGPSPMSIGLTGTFFAMDDDVLHVRTDVLYLNKFTWIHEFNTHISDTHYAN